MRTTKGGRAALVAVGLLVGSAPAQTFVVSTTEGDHVTGELVGIAGRGREANLRIRQQSDVRSVPLTRVIAIHGPAPQPVASAVAYLVGGDELRGELRGGDAAGRASRSALAASVS